MLMTAFTAIAMSFASNPNVKLAQVLRIRIFEIIN